MLPTHRVGAPACIAALAALTCACFAEGGVEIVFHWPEDGSGLSPPRDDIASITLVRTAPGEPARRVVRPMPTERGEAVDMGSIEPGDGVQLAVELRSSTQQLVGYGRSAELLNLVPGEAAEITVEVRRPFVFVTGGAAGVDAFDPMSDPTGSARHSTIVLGDAPVAVNPVAAVVTADGAELLVAAKSPDDDWFLYGLSTLDHATPTREPILLDSKPADLVVSPLGRYAVLGHTKPNDTKQGGVTVVDLQAPSATAATYYDFGSVGRVVIAPVVAGSQEERVYALVNRSLDCGGVPSDIAAIDPANPTQVLSRYSYQAEVADLTTAPDSPYVIVANHCDGTVDRVLVGSGEGHTPLAELSQVQAVATLDGKIWAVGTTIPPEGQQGTRLLVASMDFAGGGQAVAELPELQERAMTPVFSGTGEEATRQIAADRIDAIDLAVLPGSESIAIATNGKYIAAPQGDLTPVGIPMPVLPGVTLDTSEYLLVDTATFSIVQRVRTICGIEVMGPAYVLEWECSQAADQEVFDPEYPLSSLWALYGGR